MKTVKVKRYMNVESVYETILDIYKDVRDDYKDEEYFPFIESCYEDEALEEMAWGKAWAINEDMNEYLHMKDHRICGNFNNIEYDYTNFVRGEFEYDRPLLCDLVQRLDDELEDERTNAYRDFLSSWFWETFGTFGIRYNFHEELGEALYWAEEKSMAV